MSDTKQQLAVILRQLGSAVRACKLYATGHPSIHTPILHLATALSVMLKERDHIVLGLIDDVLILDEMPFYEANDEFPRVYTALRQLDVEAVLLQPGVTFSELERFVRILASQDQIHPPSILEEAQKNAMPHIAFREKTAASGDPQALISVTYEESMGEMFELLSQLRSGKIAFAENATQLLTIMREMILTAPAALFGLTLLRKYDPYTYSHSITTALFALAYARHLGIGGEDLHRVALAGLLHDVGKVRTAEKIIKKPGALTLEELEIMQKHPALSEELLREFGDVDEETRRIVLYHHIRFDGTGYPKLCQGEEPHPLSAIISIADCYDALTTTRPYQKSRHPGEAIRIIRRLIGKAYAPQIVADFVAMIGAYPVGDLVRLSSNELAVVAKLNELDATSPTVLIFQNSEGKRLDPPLACDLAAPQAENREILGIEPHAAGIEIPEILPV